MPETPVSTPADSDAENTRSPLSIAVLLIAGAVIVVIALFGAQLLSILFAILFPPMPPLPENITEIRHTNLSYGVDEWLYDSDARACEVVLFYWENGTDCPEVPVPCQGLAPDEPLLPRTHVAQCSGVQYFSLFAMRWSVNIAADSRDGSKTTFSLLREVFWGGQIPPDMEDIIHNLENQ